MRENFVGSLRSPNPSAGGDGVAWGALKFMRWNFETVVSMHERILIDGIELRIARKLHVKLSALRPNTKLCSVACSIHYLSGYFSVISVPNVKSLMVHDSLTNDGDS
jgi:hypothetical protein